MSQLEFNVPVEWQGAMLKNFLRRYCGVSARLLAKLKRLSDGISVNGVHAIATLCLNIGDKVLLTLPEGENSLPPSAIAASVVWEDNHMIVFDKPPHMAVHPSPGNGADTLANIARSYAAAQGEQWAFRPVNRLDKDTSGLVVAAKDGYTASRLAQGISKEYFAICEGELAGGGVIDTPIRLKAGHSIERETGEGGLAAVTHWEALECGCGHTLLKLWLETGRTHQIRVHMASLGHPLAGDDLYGGSRVKITRQALHCMRAQLFHPVTGESLILRAPLPEDFCRLCSLLSFQQVDYQ